MEAVFNYHSPRSRKARLASSMSKGFRYGILLLAVANVGIGAAVWPANQLVGAAILAVGLTAVLPLLWYRYDISKLEPKPPAQPLVVEDSLPPEVVGRLKSVSSPAEIWRGINGTWQQRFFSLRYGINPQNYEALPSGSENNQQIWAEALRLSQGHREQRVSIAALMVALLKILPNYQDILANANITEEELETSIDWLHHTEAVYKKLGTKKHFGGVARDWTSGYTPQLNKLAHNMTVDIEHGGFIHRDLSVHSKTVDEMLQFLGSTGRSNVALVGEVGVGKTTTAYSFAQRLLADPHVPGVLKYHKVFMLDASSLVASTNDGAKLEAIVLSMLVEAQKAKNIILFLDDAQAFFAQGTGAVDLSQVLKPVIENGSIPIIMSFTPTQWQELGAKDSHLAGLINYLAVPEADQTATMQVMEDQTLLLESQHKVMYTYQSLQETYRLAERYEHEMAFPGRAISLMETAVNHAENGLVTAASVQQSVEATRGVKVQTAGTAEKSKLINLEEQIHQRMVNQSRAVKVVSDALRRARSGVNNPDKPIGTFLFLGPTGVGKTELSKAIAASYFGSEEQMVRVDLNEYTKAGDTSRLLDPKAEDGLIASIRRQPFSVILFDEIEKAHADVVNIFLQLLDEGIMRDSENKQASFKDAVVIATSNAGADIIRQQIQAGREVSDFEKPFLDSLIDSKQFAPEFLNRFDESVVFRPLKPAELMQVVDLLLNDVNKTLERQKVQVELSDDAKQWLVENGNDPKLGARPLRRMVQRTVENIVARQLLENKVRPGGTVNLTAEELNAENSG